MNSNATSIAVPLIPQKGIWIEGVARTDLDVWHALSGKKKAPEANTTRDIPVILQSENPTVLVTDEEAESRFESLFRSARESHFEDGMESQFSRYLTSLVQAYGPISKDILARLFEDRRISPEVLSEALRWLGRMEDQPTYGARLWLLEKGLTSPDASVRDGATLGLASMDDPRAIPYLERAIQAEKMTELRHDMEEVLGQLKNGR